jgi:hypothetical protein
MTQDERQLGMGQVAIEDVQVRAADATSVDTDQDFIGANVRQRQIGEPERGASGVEKHGAHEGTPLAKR